MNGADSLVHTLLRGEVNVCFTNPGTSEMHFVSALDRIAGMRCVLGLFEGVVTGAADGYYRIREKPASTLLHLGPGLANGLSNLHNAKKAASGIVNIVGEHATTHLALNAPLTSDIEGVARPMSHWVQTCPTAAGVARAGAQAVLAANQAPGQIATLALPADTAWGDAADGLALAEKTYANGALEAARARARVSDEAVEASARALLSGEAPLLLIGGAAVRGRALELAGRIAARTGCKLLSEFYVSRGERGAGRVIAPRVPYVVNAALAVLDPYRDIVLAGATPPVAFFAYPDKPGKLAHPDARFTTLATLADDLEAALEALAERVGALKVAPALVAEAQPPVRIDDLPQGAVNLDAVARIIAALIPENAIVIDEAVTSGRAFGAATATAAPHDWLTNMGGSIGYSMPNAIGAAIAAPSRKVIVLTGDGSAMYTAQSLWTMAREGLDVTVLVFANRAYQILKGEFIDVGAGDAGPRAKDMLTLDRPDLNWCDLARGMGVAGERVTELGALARAFHRAVSTPGPKLIELVF